MKPVPMLVRLLLWHEPVEWGNAFAQLVVALLIAAIAAPSAWRPSETGLIDDHAVVSLELALTRAFCHTPSAISTAASIAPALKSDASLRAQPLRDVIAARGESLARFCAASTQTFVNNENSVTLTEAWWLRLRPSMSMEQLGVMLHVSRLAMLSAFVVVLFKLGASLWFGTAAILSGLVMMALMSPFTFSAYPFLFVSILAITALYAAALECRWADRIAGAAFVGVTAGLLSGLTVNVRSSYFAIVAAAGGLFLAAVWRQAQREGRSFVPAGVAVVAAIASYYALYAGAVRAGVPPGFEDRLSHSILHPLVLSLGVPPSAFSQEIGVEWSDAVGPKIAQRIDPQAGFQDERYNRALSMFYRGLWRDRTSDMVRLYQLKFATAGANMLGTMRDSPGVFGWLLSALLAPLSWLAKVAWLVVVDAAIAASALVGFIRTNRVTWFGLALLAGAAALLQVEAGIIYSLFLYQYHNYGAYFAVLVSLAGVQLAMNGVGQRLGWATR